MKRGKLWLIGVVTLLLLIVVVRNTGAVETDLIFFSVTLPHALLLFVTLGIGFLIGLLAAGSRQAKREKRAKREDVQEDPGTLWK